MAETPPETKSISVKDSKPEVLNPFEDIKKMSDTIKVLTDTVNSLKENVSQIIKKSPLPDSWKSSLGLFWEACGTYIIYLLVLGTGLGFLSFDSEKADMALFGALALILTVQILIGAIKTVANNKIAEKDKSIKNLEAIIRANETALNVATLQNSELRVNRDLMEKYIRENFKPEFQTSFLYQNRGEKNGL